MLLSAIRFYKILLYKISFNLDCANNWYWSVYEKCKNCAMCHELYEIMQITLPLAGTQGWLVGTVKLKELEVWYQYVVLFINVMTYMGLNGFPKQKQTELWLSTKIILVWWLIL